MFKGVAFIEGKFEKYMNNTGDDAIRQRAECLSHFSHEISNSQLLAVDLQVSGHNYVV